MRADASPLTPDLCVIGAGSGGLSVAAGAAAFGVPVVLVEKGAMGGDCLNVGCVPSKALIAAARQARALRSGVPFGVTAAEPVIDFARVLAHVREVIAAIEPNDSEARFTGLGVTVIRAAARFVDPSTVEAGGRRVKARRFVIATGSRPAVPPIEGLADVPFLTNETLFDLAALPAHLLVLGGGPIGCEMAQAFRRLGSRVTLIEQDRLLARDDPEATAVVAERLVAEGIVLDIGAPVTAARRTAHGVALALGARHVEGSHLLVATGRTAVVEGLGLDAGNIAYTARGITVDAGLRSPTNRRVYAVGDVAGLAQFTHAASYQAGLVIRSALFRLPVRADPAAIPHCTFTDPELAQAGLTEAEARARHQGIEVLRVPFRDNDRAQTERATEGFLKVMTTKRGRVLGATIVGQGAGELANMWQLAVSQRLNIRAFAGVVSPYPTRAEVGKRAAYTFFMPPLTSPMVRRIIAILRRFG